MVFRNDLGQRGRSSQDGPVGPQKVLMLGSEKLQGATNQEHEILEGQSQNYTEMICLHVCWRGSHAEPSSEIHSSFDYICSPPQ